MWIVFKYAHRGFRRVETRAAALKYFVAGRKRAFESGAIFALALRSHVASLDSSGTAVDCESNFLCFHAWLIVWFSLV
jgi:hypothetical protein